MATSAEEIEAHRQAFLRMDYQSQIALQFFINEMLDLTPEPVSPLPPTPKNRKENEDKKKTKKKTTSPKAGPMPVLAMKRHQSQVRVPVPARSQLPGSPRHRSVAGTPVNLMMRASPK